MSDETYKVQPETAARLVDIALETLRRQLATADALDSKAWQAFGAGSLVIGLAIAGDLGGWSLVFAAPGYIAVAWGALACLRVREFDVVPSTDNLWRGNYFRPQADLDHAVIDALIQTQTTNAGHLHDKATNLRWALRGLAAETAALLVVAIF